MDGLNRKVMKTMKRLTLIAAYLLFLTSAGFAQGTVQWTFFSPYMTAQTNSTQASPLFGGHHYGAGTIGAVAPAGTFYFELLYGPFTGVQANPPASFVQLAAWSDSGLEAVNSAIPGRFTPLNMNLGATVPWAAGVTDSIVMVGWSANLGTSWSAAEAVLEGVGVFYPAWVGFSATGYIAPLNYAPGAELFGNVPTAQGLPIYSPNAQLYIADFATLEPGALALVGSGGLTLWLFRRRE